MDRQLAPQNGQRGLAVNASVGLEGVDDFSLADLEIPVIKIAHGVSKMDDAEQHVGQWWNSATGEFMASFDAVILNERPSRAKFGDDENESRPECVSNDGVTGSYYGNCSECQFNGDYNKAMWDKENNRIRCSSGRALMLYMPDSDAFTLFRAIKTNWPVIRALHTKLVFKHKIHTIFGVLINFATERNVDGVKKWFTVKPTVQRILSPDEVAEYRQMATALRGVSVRIVDEEAPVAGEQGETPPADSYDDAAMGDPPVNPAGEDPWDAEAAGTLLGGKR